MCESFPVFQPKQLFNYKTLQLKISRVILCDVWISVPHPRGENYKIERKATDWYKYVWFWAWCNCKFHCIKRGKNIQIKVNLLTIVSKMYYTKFDRIVSVLGFEFHLN